MFDRPLGMNFGGVQALNLDDVSNPRKFALIQESIANKSMRGASFQGRAHGGRVKDIDRSTDIQGVKSRAFGMCHSDGYMADSSTKTFQCH